MNKYKRKLTNRNKTHNKSNELKHLKSEIQKDQRQAYWNYVVNMIFDIPIPDQGVSHNTKNAKKPIFLH